MSDCIKEDCLCRLDPVQEDIDRPLDDTWPSLDWDGRLSRIVACIRAHPWMQECLKPGIRNIKTTWRGRKPRKGKYSRNAQFQES